MVALMKTRCWLLFTGAVLFSLSSSLFADNLSPKQEEAAELGVCAHSLAGGFL
jgi:hypothetical protein